MSKIIAWRVGKNNNQFSTGVTTGHNYTAPPRRPRNAGGPKGKGGQLPLEKKKKKF